MRKKITSRRSGFEPGTSNFENRNVSHKSTNLPKTNLILSTPALLNQVLYASKESFESNVFILKYRVVSRPPRLARLFIQDIKLHFLIRLLPQSHSCLPFILFSTYFHTSLFYCILLTISCVRL